MATKSLGIDEIQAGWRVRGEFDAARLLLFCEQLIRFVEMTPEGAWDLQYFQPRPERNGGLGLQAYHALTESWIIFSTWPQHGFVRITLASCKPFNVKLVRAFIETNLGPVDKAGHFEL